MKKLVAILLVLVMVFSLCACAGGKKDKKEVLILGTSADYAPYEFMYPDDSGKMQYAGIDVFVAQYIAAYLGMELQIENMDFNYLLTALNKGDFDMVLACIEPTEDRVKAVDFSDAYIHELPEMFLVRAEDADKYNDISTDFAGANVGAQAGSTKVAKAEDNCTGANVVSLSLVTDLVNELANGKIDAVLLDGAIAVNYTQTSNDYAIAGASDFFADAENYCSVAVAKSDPKGLLPKINEAIAKMIEEGKVEEFKAKADELSGVAQEITGDVPEGYTPDSE